MNRTSIPISEITILDRQRADDSSHIDSLAESMRRLGLIQPIVINQDKRLIAGQQRLAAAKRLGWTSIDVVYKETLSEDELQELELTENLRRKNLTWQENCIAIAKIHWLKRKRASLDSVSWGQNETGELLGVSQASVSQALYMAKFLLEQTDKEICSAENYDQAYNVLLRREQELAEAELATRHTSTEFEEDDIALPPKAADATDAAHPCTDTEIQQTYDNHLRAILEEKGREGYYLEVNEYPHLVNRIKEHYIAAGNQEENFLTYWSEKLKENKEFKLVIDLSSHYIKGDSITFMQSHPESFDHIITDIPYGIDIDYIDQHIGMKDIETIKDEHTVEGNLKLFELFFPAAFTTLKPNAFLITWCDQMNWQYMYDLAIAAGFKVQRWPITWSKTHQCLNQMAQYNFTKSTEIAMVCRKGVITLPEKQPNSVIEAGRDELCDLINHPFAKPFECWRRLITAVSIENQSILDPFCGRGSSFLSGLKLGRNMFGIELNEQHFNAGLENIKQFYLKLNPETVFK